MFNLNIFRAKCETRVQLVANGLTRRLSTVEAGIFIRRRFQILAPLLALAACAQAPAPDAGPFAAQPAIAEQRLAYAVESVCVQNRTPGAQRAAAGRLGFAATVRRGAETTYLNPATGTILAIGPVPGQSISVEGGARRAVPPGSGCWAGSPALPTQTANRIAGRLVATRVVDADALTRAPIAVGRSEEGGVGIFFERVAVTVADVTTVFGAEDGGDDLRLTYPVILVRHTRPASTPPA